MSVFPEILKTTGVPALTVVDVAVTSKSGEGTEPLSQAAINSDIPMNVMIFFMVLSLSGWVKIPRFVSVSG